MDEFRPRGLGEIIDRAIALYVRNFVVFMSIMLCLLLPMAAAEYFLMPDSSATNAAFFQTIVESRGGGHQTPEEKARTAKVLNQNQLTPQQLALLLLILLVSPLATVATAVAVAHLYVAQKADWRASWRAALRRWPRIVGLTCLELIALGITGFTGFFALTIGTVVGVLALRSVPPFAFAVLAIAAVLGLVWFVVFLMQALLVFSFALYAVAIEDMPVFRAFRSGFFRVFDRTAFRSALVAIIAMAVEFGILILSMGGQLLFSALWHNHAVNVAYGTLVQTLFTGFLTVFIAVYYFDVRTRAEGLDLQARLQPVHGVLGTP